MISNAIKRYWRRILEQIVTVKAWSWKLICDNFSSIKKVHKFCYCINLLSKLIIAKKGDNFLLGQPNSVLCGTWQWNMMHSLFSVFFFFFNIIDQYVKACFPFATKHLHQQYKAKQYRHRFFILSVARSCVPYTPNPNTMFKIRVC